MNPIEANLKLALEALKREHDQNLAANYIHIALRYVREVEAVDV